MNTFSFRKEDHSYWLGDKRVPGVSEILSQQLGGAGTLQDFSMIDPAVLQRKIEIGRAVHLLAEWYDLGEDIDPDSIDPACAGYFNGWRRFCAEMRPQFDLAAIEQPVYSPLGFAGTPDRPRTVIDGTRWTIDIKTVVAVSPVTGLQTAAYAELCQDRSSRRGAVQLTDDGNYRLHEFTDPADWPTFLSLLTVHNWRKNHGR